MRWRKILRASASLAFSRVLRLALPLLTIPLTIDHLGTERFGMWMAATSFVAILMIAEGGLANSVVTATARARAADDVATIRRISSSAFALILPICLAVSLAALALVPRVDWGAVLNLADPLAMREAAPVILVIVVSTALSFVVEIGVKLQTGLNEIPRTSLWHAIGTALSLPAFLLAIALGLGTPWLVGAIYTVPILVRGIGALIFFVNRPELAPRRREADLRMARTLLGTGAMFLVVTLANALAVSADQFLIAALVSADAVAPYAVLQRLFAIPLVFGNFIFAAQWPAFSDAIARGEAGWVRQAFLRTMIVVLPAALVVSVGLSVFIGPILAFWIGDAFAVETPLVVGMAVYAVLQVAVVSCSTLLHSFGVRRPQVVTSLAMLAVNLPLTIVLIREIGPAGAIIATNASFFLCILVPYAIYIRRVFAAHGTGKASDRAG